MVIDAAIKEIERVTLYRITYTYKKKGKVSSSNSLSHQYGISSRLTFFMIKAKGETGYEI